MSIARAAPWRTRRRSRRDRERLRCGARRCRPGTSWSWAETRSIAQADESIGKEHDVIAGDFELPDPARRVVDRSNAPRQATGRDADMQLRRIAGVREDMEFARDWVDRGMRGEGPQSAGEVDGPDGVELRNELACECTVPEGEDPASERDDLGRVRRRERFRYDTARPSPSVTALSVPSPMCTYRPAPTVRREIDQFSALPVRRPRIGMCERVGMPSSSG